MKRRRKTLVAMAEPGTLTDELPGATTMTFQTEQDFFKKAAKELGEFRAGRRTKPVATVSFESVAAFLAVLTPKRYEIIEMVKERGRFYSIGDLAAALHRDRAAVSRDLKALTDSGLIQMHEAVLSGHGRRSEIAPAAKRLKVELSL